MGEAVLEDAKILLVEDNEDHAELVKRAFEAHGITRASLYHLKDGQEALDYLHRRGRFVDPAMSPIPALILLDLRLPKIEGLEVLREIKESDETRRIPVFILTTSDSARDKCLAYGVHPNSYLLKPHDIVELFELIGNLVNYSLKRNPAYGN